jgi:hypothetical protein
MKKNTNDPTLTRRELLQRVAAGGTASMATWAARPFIMFAAEPSLALRFAQLLNRTRFEPGGTGQQYRGREAVYRNELDGGLDAYKELPPKAIEHAKMILASTLASAAAGSLIDSARIVRELAKERGGKPEATIWFDGAKFGVNEVARINAMLSDAAASDDTP